MTDPHERFHLWLTAGAEGDPPRDLAVHASVCAGCRLSIAALDLLATVDPKRAAMPLGAAAPERRGWLSAGRLTPAAAGIILSAVILGIGASQLIAMARTGTARSSATASPTPAQTVLGSEATAQPGKPSPTLTAETLTPLTSPSPTPQPTTRPTPRPTPKPTTPAATPTPMLTVAPTATPSPSIPDAPVLSATTGTSTKEINLSWSTPNDGGETIIGYDVYFAPDDSLAGSIPFGTNSLLVSGLMPGDAYSFYVVARNVIGSSSHSNTASANAGI